MQRMQMRRDSSAQSNLVVFFKEKAQILSLAVPPQQGGAFVFRGTEPRPPGYMSTSQCERCSSVSQPVLAGDGM